MLDLASCEIISTLEGQARPIVSAAMNWTAKVGVAGCEDMTITSWDLDTLVRLQTFVGHSQVVTTLCVDLDQMLLASSSLDATVRFWDARLGTCTLSLVYKNIGFRALTVDFQSGRFLVGGDDAIIREGNSIQQRCLKVLAGHAHTILSIEGNWSLNQAVSSSADKTLRLWDLEAGTALHVFRGHKYPVRHVCVNWSQRVMISASHDVALRRWNLDGGSCELVHKDHCSTVCTTTLVMACRNPKMTIKEMVFKAEKEQTQHTQFVRKHNQADGDDVGSPAVFAAPSEVGTEDGYGSHNANASMDRVPEIGNVIILRAVAGAAVGEVPLWVPFCANMTVHDLKVKLQKITSVARFKLQLFFHNCTLFDGETLVSAGVEDGSVVTLVQQNRLLCLSCAFDHTLKLWDADTGETLQSYEALGEPSPLAVAVDSSALLAFVGYNRGPLKLLDLEGGKVIKHLEGHARAVFTVAMNYPIKLGVAGSEDCTVSTWNLETGFRLHTFVGHYKQVMVVRVDWKSMRIASSSLDSSVAFWDIQKKRCILRVDQSSSELMALSVDFESCRFISGGDDAMVRLWCYGADLGARVLKVLAGHASAILTIEADWPTNRAVSASGDSSVRLWDLESGTALQVFRGHDHAVWHLCVDWLLGVMISASHDRTLRRWNLDDGSCELVYKNHRHSVCKIAWV